MLGVVSITEVDVASIKGQLDRPVSGYMKLRAAVTLTTPVSECEKILVEQGEGTYWAFPKSNDCVPIKYLTFILFIARVHPGRREL